MVTKTENMNKYLKINSSKDIKPMKLKVFIYVESISVYKTVVFHGPCSSCLVAIGTFKLPLTFYKKLENYIFFAMPLRIF